MQDTKGRTLVSGSGPTCRRFLTTAILRHRIRALAAGSMAGRNPNVTRQQRGRVVMRAIPVNSNHTFQRIADRVLDKAEDIRELEDARRYVRTPYAVCNCLMVQGNDRGRRAGQEWQGSARGVQATQQG